MCCQRLAAAYIHSLAQVLRQSVGLSVSQQGCVWPADLLAFGQQQKTDLCGGKQKLTKSKDIKKLN